MGWKDTRLILLLVAALCCSGGQSWAAPTRPAKNSSPPLAAAAVSSPANDQGLDALPTSIGSASSTQSDDLGGNRSRDETRLDVPPAPAEQPPVPQSYPAARGLFPTELLEGVSALALFLAVIALVFAFAALRWKSKMNRFARSRQFGPNGAPPLDFVEAVEMLATEMERHRGEVAELRGQLTMLKRSVEGLNAARGLTPMEPETRTSGSRAPIIHARPGTMAATSSQPDQYGAKAEASVEPGWRSGLLARFREATLDPSDAGYRLMQDFRIRGAGASGTGYALSDNPETAKLWAVPAPTDPNTYLLLPGYSAISNWSAHFSPHRQTAAADVFGSAFDLVEGGGGALVVEAPALARDDGGSLIVTQRGRLSGFRS